MKKGGNSKHKLDKFSLQESPFESRVLVILSKFLDIQATSE